MAHTMQHEAESYLSHLATEDGAKRAKAKRIGAKPFYVLKKAVVKPSGRSIDKVQADLAAAQVSNLDYEYHKSHGFTGSVTSSEASNYEVYKLLQEEATAMPKHASVAQQYSFSEPDLELEFDEYINYNVLRSAMALSGRRDFLIQAPTGSGKSTFFRQVAADNISGFTAVSAFNTMSTHGYTQGLGGAEHVFYRSEGDISAKFVACTLHQLPKVFHTHLGEYRILGLDETVTALSAFGQPDGLLNGLIIDSIAAAAKSADLLIAMDAYADDNTADRVAQMTGRGKPFCIKITLLKPQALVEAMRSNVATAIDAAVTESERGMVTFHIDNKASLAELAEAGAKANRRVLIVSSDDDKEFAAKVALVHAGDYDILGYTSKLGSGFDLQVPCVLAISCVNTAHTDVRSNLQAFARARKAKQKLLVYTNIATDKVLEPRCEIGDSLAHMCYKDDLAARLVITADKLYDTSAIGANAKLVEQAIEDCKGENVDDTLNSKDYMAEAYALGGRPAFLALSKRVKDGWVNAKLLATLVVSDIYNLGIIECVDLARSTPGALALNFSNGQQHNAKSIATALDITETEAKLLVWQALDRAEESPNSFPKHYVQRFAAIDRMRVTGKMTEADKAMFSTSYVNRALSTVGLQVKPCGKGMTKRKCTMTEFYKAVTFGRANPRLVHMLIDPSNATDSAEYLAAKHHLAEDLAYAKVTWPLPLTAEVRDLA